MHTTFFGSCGLAVTPVPATSEPGAIAGDLQIQSLSGSQWRVCDRRWSQDDARNLLGFIEKTANGLFEVIHLGDGFQRFSYASLAEATAHFTDAQPLDTGKRVLGHSRPRIHEGISS